MPGSVYDRRMFQMANGGMLPPPVPPQGGGMPPQGGGMPPGMMPPGMMPPQGGGMPPEELPPELIQMADQEMDAATGEALASEVEQAVSEEAAESIQDMDMAGDYGDIMNAVWDGDANIEEYRARLAAVVGPDDAARTPDSVLALVQPTLQIAEIDQGIGALMQEELSEVGGAGGGITELAAKSAVADGMAAETGALVNAVGNMAQGAGPMGGEQMAMEEIAAAMQGAGPVDQGLV